MISNQSNFVEFHFFKFPNLTRKKISQDGPDAQTLISFCPSCDASQWRNLTQQPPRHIWLGPIRVVSWLRHSTGATGLHFISDSKIIGFLPKPKLLHQFSHSFRCDTKSPKIPSHLFFFPGFDFLGSIFFFLEIDLLATERTRLIAAVFNLL